MPALFIILTILLVIIILLLINVRIYVTYSDRLIAEVQYLFIRKYIYPKYKKFKEKDENGKTVTVIREVKEKSILVKAVERYIEQLEFSTSDNLKLIKNALKMVFNKLIWILKRIRIKKLDARVNVARGDAAKTALAYGATNAGIYSLLSVIKAYIKVDNDDVLVSADFLGESNSYKVDAVITAKLITAIVLIISLVIEEKKLYNEIESIKEKYQ